MEQRTCDRCGSTIPPNKRSDAKYCSTRCAKRASQQRARDRGAEHAFRKAVVTFTCAHCGNIGKGGNRKQDREHLRRYCSPRCDREARSSRLKFKCEHGSDKKCPVCSFTDRAERAPGWKTVLRSDPCAYCGTKPSSGIDHIDPRNRGGSRSHWTNLAGCCKRCNEIKGSLPLLLALEWIPVAKEYHERRRLLFGGRS